MSTKNEKRLESTIFDSPVSLDRLIETSLEINEATKDRELKGWVFITRHFIYRGEDKTVSIEEPKA